MIKIARTLCCHDDTIYTYARRYPEVGTALQEERERLLEVAESRLHDAIDAGEPRAITFLLRSLGKSRGYTERIELPAQRPQRATITIERSPSRDNDLSDPADSRTSMTLR